MVVNIAQQARMARTTSNVVDANGAVRAAKPSFLDRLNGGLNYLVMGPLVLGMVVGKGVGWIGRASKSPAITNFARKFGEFDRATHLNSLADIAGNIGKSTPSVGRAFAGASERVGDALSSSAVGEAVTSGKAAGVMDNVANKTGISKVFKWYQKQNLLGANGFHENLAEQLSAVRAQASELGHHGISSQISGLMSRVDTVENARIHGPEVMKEMRELAGKVNGMRAGVVGKEASALSSLHREIASSANTINNVMNKATKANYSSLSHYVTDLPKRWGSSMSAGTALFGATNVLYTASNVAGTVKEGRSTLKDLHTAYTQMTGKTISDKALLTSADVPDAIKVMRKSMGGTLGNLGLNLAGFAGSQVAFMRGGASMKTAMIGMALQQGTSAIANMLIPKSESLAAFNAVETAQANGANVPASTYIDVVASVNKKAAKSGLYGKTEMRADYLALYAEKHQLKAGELLAIADKAGNDPAAKQQVTAEIDAMLAERKQAAAQAKFNAQGDLNPNARTDNVQRLNQARGMQIGQPTAGQARA